MTEMNRIARGRSGEDEAADFLARSGLKIIERNFRCPGGELDIVARDGKTVVFVEVRSRVANRFGGPEESIGGAKQKKILRAAQWYLKKRGCENSSARIDVVAIRWNGEEPEINWIVNAIEARS
ncbi:MAG: YraN family protein [Syntrophobacteraceae bacterium]